MSTSDSHGKHEHAHSFDDRAQTWDDDPDKLRRAEDIAALIRDRLPLNPATRVLEYGAGTGLLSQALAPWVGRIMLTDVSEGMLEVMRRKVADGTIPNAEVAKLDLLRQAAPGPDFDLAASLLTLHHVSDVPTVLSGLYAALAAGGAIAVSDLDAEDGSFHGEQADVHHHGFDREGLATKLRAAGFEHVAVIDAGTLSKQGQEFSMFLATGIRP